MSTIENQTQPNLSEYHQTRLSFIRHLVQTGPQPAIAFATYTHPGFDPEQRVVVGDILWNTFKARFPDITSAHNLIWEPMPPGYNNSIEIPVLKDGIVSGLRITSGFNTLPWWNAKEGQFFSGIGLNLSRNLRGAKELLKQPMANKTPKVLNRVISKIDVVRKIQQDVYQGDGLNPVGMYQNIYQALVRLTFGDSVADLLPETKPYSTSEIYQMIRQNLLLISTELGLKEAVGRSLIQGQASLWISGNSDGLSYIGFSTEQDSFATSRQDPKTGKRIGKSKNISERDVLDGIDNSSLIPTGRIAMLAQLYQSQTNLLLHDGNDYNVAQQIKQRLFANTDTHYHQVYEDCRNTWPVVKISNGNRESYTPTLVGLYLTTDQPQALEQLLYESIKRGRSLEFTLDELTNL